MYLFSNYISVSIRSLVTITQALPSFGRYDSCIFMVIINNLLCPTAGFGPPLGRKLRPNVLTTVRNISVGCFQAAQRPPTELRDRSPIITTRTDCFT